jgi:hypothetical protein
MAEQAVFMAKDDEKEEKAPAQVKPIRAAAPKPAARSSHETVQNEAPQLGWASFDHFWSVCIKGGTPAVKNACIAHLKATNSWQDQSKWIAGVRHFGIPVEK